MQKIIAEARGNSEFDTSFNIRLDSASKQAFTDRCAELQLSAGSAIRAFMRRFVEETNKTDE